MLGVGRTCRERPISHILSGSALSLASDVPLRRACLGWPAGEWCA